MQVFYAPDIEGKKYTLDRSESKHLVKVLRYREGSLLSLIDGKGTLYRGILSDASPDAATIEITETVENFEKRPYHLHLAVSPLKNPERYEWMVEKCVELGVDAITPLLCKRTERKSVKEERLKNIVISAMKQSLKATLTVINEPADFEKFILSRRDGRLLIPHCNTGFGRIPISSACSRGETVTVLIGPEGDFTSEEIAMATESGAVNVHLGTSRLRTETAALAACHSVYFINQ